MGFHLVDILIVAAIGLALLGPKTLQSIARSTGKSAGQAKNLKNTLMAELPMEEIAKVKGQIPQIPQIPLNSRQAIQMLVAHEGAEKKELELKPVEAEPRPQEGELEEMH